MQPRKLEEEAMMSEEEVVAYDLLVRKYLKILHAGFVETVLNLSPPSGKFLDVGTGTGWIAIGVAKNNPEVEVTAVDLSETMLKVAEKNARDEGVADRVRFLKGDAKNLPFETKSFDAVFSHNMMHHLPDPIAMVLEIKRLARDDGAILIRDLKRHSKMVTEFHVKVFGLTYDEMMKKEYRDSILAALSESEWQELLEEADISGAQLQSQFVTHMSIERPSERRRRERAEVATPALLKPMKNMYSSR